MQCFSSPLNPTHTTLNAINTRSDLSVQRRSANYKPNIWKYGLLSQSLTSKYYEDEYTKKAKKLKQELKCMFSDGRDPMSEQRLVDSIVKLGLASYFQDEIKHSLEAIISSSEKYFGSSIEDDLYSTALCFRLLRQFGYTASQEMFQGFVNEAGKFKSSAAASNVAALTELYEASNLGCQGENLLDEARLFSIESLGRFDTLPLHWTAEWYSVKEHILAYEEEDSMTGSKLMELARLNFNIVQAAHQKDLKKISRWWMDLGISEKLSFSRDRTVESFLFAGGVAFEPQHENLRNWLSKVINLVLVIDDVYDTYGSLEDLERFTIAVERWRPEEVKNLPECMKICFWTLYNTADEIAVKIQKDKGWNSVLPHLQKAWAGFCKSLLMEARWDNNGYTPSLQEYLDNASISSSGPLLSLHVIFGVENPTSRNASEIQEDCREIINYASLIIRLCNDLATSTLIKCDRAELERGDAPSSILCYMRESNVSEDAARAHIKKMILRTWKKINGFWISNGPITVRGPIKYLTNAARAAHFMYQNGDGFGVQDGKRVLSNLIEPIAVISY